MLSAVVVIELSLVSQCAAPKRKAEIKEYTWITVMGKNECVLFPPLKREWLHYANIGHFCLSYTTKMGDNRIGEMHYVFLKNIPRFKTHRADNAINIFVSSGS